MANGGSPMPSPRTAPSSMSVMPSPTATVVEIQNSCYSLLQPGQHHFDRSSFDTLTSVASSNQDNVSTQLRRPACYSTSPNPSERTSTHATDVRPRPLLSQHRLNRSSRPSLPPSRALPALRTTDAEVHWNGSFGETDQFDEESPTEKMIPAGLDLTLGSLYGFPYNMGVSSAMEQRSKALAEAEELEYRREREMKQKARLSGRMSLAFESVSLPGILPWTRRCQR